MTKWDKRLQRICSPITIPKHEPIKRVYVELVKEVVEKEDANHENN